MFNKCFCEVLVQDQSKVGLQLSLCPACHLHRLECCRQSRVHPWEACRASGGRFRLANWRVPIAAGRWTSLPPWWALGPRTIRTGWPSPVRAGAWPSLGKSKGDEAKKEEKGSHLEAASWRTQRTGEVLLG